MKKGYTIDFTTNTVTITKGFAQKASTVGSDEFNTLMKLRELGLNIVNAAPKTKSRRRNGALTYSMMRLHMSHLADSEAYLDEFDAVREESKSHSNPYNYVRRWFENRFPNYNSIPHFDENLKIVNIPVNYDNDALSA